MTPTRTYGNRERTEPGPRIAPGTPGGPSHDSFDSPGGGGFQDVISGSFDTYVYAMSGVDGSIIWTFGTGNRVDSVASVGDLDLDGVPEVGVATQDITSSTVVYVVGWSPPLFADDFESGTTGAWSFVMP